MPQLCRGRELELDAIIMLKNINNVGGNYAWGTDALWLLFPRVIHHHEWLIKNCILIVYDYLVRKMWSSCSKKYLCMNISPSIWICMHACHRTRSSWASWLAGSGQVRSGKVGRRLGGTKPQLMGKRTHTCVAPPTSLVSPPENWPGLASVRFMVIELVDTAPGFIHPTR